MMIQTDIQHSWQKVLDVIDVSDLPFILQVTRREMFIGDHVRSPLDLNLDRQTAFHWITQIEALAAGLAAR